MGQGATQPGRRTPRSAGSSAWLVDATRRRHGVAELLTVAGNPDRSIGWKMVLPDRIELSTSPLPRECSTTELRQRREGALTSPFEAARTMPHAARRFKRRLSAFARICSDLCDCVAQHLPGPGHARIARGSAARLWRNVAQSRMSDPCDRGHHDGTGFARAGLAPRPDRPRCRAPGTTRGGAATESVSSQGAESRA